MTQAIYLNADRKQTTPVVHMVQGDTGRELECHITDLVLTGTDSAAIWCERPDGSVWAVLGTISGNVATFALGSGGPLTQAGSVKAQVKITSADTNVVSTFDLVIEVHENVSGQSTPADETWRDSLAASLQTDIDSKVPKTTTVNGKALGSNIVLNAEDVPYDNTASGLSATNTQAAIDELDASLDSALTKIANIGKNVSNSNLVEGKMYVVQFRDTNVGYKYVSYPLRANPGFTYHLPLNMFNDQNSMFFFAIEVKFANGAWAIQKVMRFSINSSAQNVSVDDKTANMEITHVWQVSP